MVGGKLDVAPRRWSWVDDMVVKLVSKVGFGEEEWLIMQGLVGLGTLTANQ